MRIYSFIKGENLLYFLSILAITFSVSLVLMLSLTYTFLAQAAADDYCTASLPQTSGFWYSNVTLQYSQWTGRWLATAIYSSLFPRLGIDTVNYNIFLMLSPIFWGLTFYIMLRVILFASLTRLMSFFFAIILTAIFWAYLPAVGQLWYWATGIVEYQLPFLLLTLGAASVLAISRNITYRNRYIFLTVVAMICGVAVSGLNELLGLYFVAFCALQLGLAIIRSNGRSTFLLGIVFLTAGVGFYISVSAPGNAVRAAGEFPNAMRFLPAFLAFLYDPENSFFSWIINPALICLVVTLLAHIGKATNPISLRHVGSSLEGKALGLPFLVFVAFAAWFGGRSIVTFAQGTILPGRVSNVLFAVFIGSILLLLPAIFAWLQSRSISPARWPCQIPLIALFILSLSLITAPNTSAAINDLKYNFTEYRPTIEARKKQIRNEPDDANISFIGLHRPPRLFFQPELSSDPEYWENKCYARYYGVKSVRIVNE